MNANIRRYQSSDWPKDVRMPPRRKLAKKMQAWWGRNPTPDMTNRQIVETMQNLWTKDVMDSYYE